MADDTLKWLDEIEAQMDSTVPYYVPRLIAEIRRYHSAEQAFDQAHGLREQAWCETCQSWRHTQPCGRDECPVPS